MFCFISNVHMTILMLSPSDCRESPFDLCAAPRPRFGSGLLRMLVRLGGVVSLVWDPFNGGVADSVGVAISDPKGL